MNTWQAAVSGITLAIDCGAGASEGMPVLAQGTQQDLKGMEAAGQRDDMRRETAAQTAQYKEAADVAKAKWDKLTPAEKKSVRRSAWQKKRADLDGLEAVGQRDDSYVLPY